MVQARERPSVLRRRVRIAWFQKCSFRKCQIHTYRLCVVAHFLQFSVTLSIANRRVVRRSVQRSSNLASTASFLAIRVMQGAISC